MFILGHVNTDYDAMGAALAASNWVRALGKDPYIVLKDVPRDSQLSDTMNAYSSTILSRHRCITEEQALEMADDKKDLLVLVDHSNPAISSGKELLKRDIRKVIIDHHRRNAEASQENVLVSYIEPEASSTCELMTELLESSTVSIPIYEMEATIMYLGIVVDTSRFKQHTSERTFQAAATLRSWGANANRAEQALQVDYSAYRRKAQMIEKAKLYRDKYLIDILDEPVSRTMLSKISDELLSFKGCSAAFTIGINENNGSVAVSARSDGSVNVQKIMEK
ncbi:DHH family phosphoesterase [Allobaculum sp. Allo2]|uniref:DHH family phosphoesterase n=1 Tax=Allobaculum sp. Allo2 TaxID=2853432 RepID=UPI001F605410|nr:DHH family phosphoesterase [Allobaculum sp. Allo2]UNT93158.1 DHH family phosphoesterase [Allobaculum sp. Allo2]